MPKRQVFRVRGIIPMRRKLEVFSVLSEVSLSQTPQIQFTRTFQDMRSDKLRAKGLKKRNRKDYGKTAFIEFKSNNREDMIALHEKVKQFFLPDGDSSKL